MELLECPFCPNKARIIKYAEDDFIIRCSFCECELGGECLDELAERWNARNCYNTRIENHEDGLYVCKNVFKTEIEDQSVKW